MKTFQEFIELAESSRSEKGKRRLSPRGPKKPENSYWGKESQRQVSNLSALRRAGFRGKPSSLSRTQYDDHYHTSSPHHSTNVSSFKSQIDMALADMEPKKKMSNKGDSVVPTSKRVRQARNIRRALGGSRTSKPVHDISIHSDDDIENYGKNDSHKLITRGKSFKKELSGVRDAIIDAGGKSGDIVTATPTALMPGEDKKKGAKKRANIYQKEFKTKKPDRKTGLMVGRLSESKARQDIESSRYEDDVYRTTQQRINDPRLRKLRRFFNREIGRYTV